MKDPSLWGCPCFEGLGAFGVLECRILLFGALGLGFLVWGFGLLSSLFRFSAFLGSLLRVGLGFRVAIRSLGLEGAWVIVTVCVWFGLRPGGR